MQGLEALGKAAAPASCLDSSAQEPLTVSIAQATAGGDWSLHSLTRSLSSCLHVTACFCDGAAVHGRQLAALVTHMGACDLALTWTRGSPHCALKNLVRLTCQHGLT